MQATPRKSHAPTFRGLLLMLRGRAGLTQRELAYAIGVSDRAVQVWEGGLGHPSALSLQRLIALYVQLAALGHVDEASSLWAAAINEGSRFKAAFDAEWFAALMASVPDGVAAPGPTRLAVRRHDWGEAPAVSTFHGRIDEHKTLTQWLWTDRCRLVGVVGMGGIGKTALAAKVADGLSSQFDAVFWRSLRNAPPSADLLSAAILLEPGDQEATFTLQPVVLEHVTELLISTGLAEITNRQPRVLVSHAFIKAQSMEYVRRSQERLIAAPLIDRLASSDQKQSTESMLLDLLDDWRGRPDAEQGYGPGNVVNLLRLVRGHLQHLDLSGLLLRQTDFGGINAQDTSLAHSRVDRAIFDQQFGGAMCTSLSADGAFLVVGTLAGEVRVWSLVDRTPVMLVHQPTGAAWDVSISADGAVVASCGGDATVLSWPRSGRAPTVFRTEGRESWRVALSGDGRVVAGGAVRRHDPTLGHAHRAEHPRAGVSYRWSAGAQTQR